MTKNRQTYPTATLGDALIELPIIATLVVGANLALAYTLVRGATRTLSMKAAPAAR